MKLGRIGKSIGTAAFTLAAISSLSMVAFAQEGKSVPMRKLTSSTAATATTAMTGTDLTDEEQVAAIMTRTNEKTGKLEISEDSGLTWSEYDGRAFATTPAMVGQNQ